ncbi:MAG TPA: ABC transporter ATP-binding protein [Chitinophaga sp.]|uniref:ABC transporter ATP-binding protein n=1 Tax=Chitinophaga sp. TaxID=1869181 RepID=UPI002CFF29E5|nr:ABC transporter ATP-binding protein [Chitinophaga sp.]HVI45590.1 ABC transporter ATP-binding protein [Chitinophaga sp.]
METGNDNALKKALSLYKYIRPYWKVFTLGMLFLIVSSALSLAIPGLLGKIVDVIRRGGVRSEINQLGMLILGLLVAQAVCVYARVLCFVTVTEKGLASLRQQIYNHLIQLPLTFFQSRRTGELYSRISADIALLQQTFSVTIAEFFRQVIIIIGGIVLLLTTSLKLTLFMVALLPPVMLLGIFFGRYVRRFSKEVQQRAGEASTIVEETLQGIISVKVFVNELFEMKRYGRKVQEAAHTAIRGGRYQGALTAFLALGVFGAMIIIVWKGALLVSSGEMKSVGDLFTFIIYSGFVGGAVTELAEAYSGMQKSIGATEHLFEILDVPVEPVVREDDISEHTLNGHIRFDHVAFHYPSRKEVQILKDVSFSLERDQKIAIVGPSGAGKSTIINLILGLYPAEKGNIYFDGKVITSFPLAALRSQIAVVMQDVFLFGSTIRENIAYGRIGATDEEVIAAAKEANAWEFISTLSAGLDTIVGERGLQLSGGQRQRISIARAVLKNPRILILDEATSALDSVSEKLVQEALEKLLEGRTTIIIAHRLSTIRQADKIIVMDKGNVVEEGTHFELLQIEGGVYGTLSAMQVSDN